MRRPTVFVVLAFACLFVACAPAYAPPPIETPVITTPAPTPPPAPTPSPAERAEQLDAAFRAVFTEAFVLPEYLFSETMGEFMAQVDTWKTLYATMPQCAEEAFAAACEACNEQAGEFSLTLPPWRMLVTILFRFGDRTPAMFATGSHIVTEINGTNVSMQVAFDDFKSTIADKTLKQQFGATLSYAYFNTLYDDEGQETDYVHYTFPEGYLETLIEPLPERHIKDGWYKPRSMNTRRHTGTDIRAPEGTDILSCTDGTVLYIDYNDSAGNYVTVLDDFGFEYHYYHMVRLTEFLSVGERVKQGDVLGHVGNTGNSTANHLHLGMISPDYTYINPYLVLKLVREMAGGELLLGEPTSIPVFDDETLAQIEEELAAASPDATPELANPPIDATLPLAVCVPPSVEKTAVPST